MKKAILWANLLALGLFVFSGCSKKKDDPNPSANQKHMKFSITTTGLTAADNFTVQVSGSDVQTSTTTIYKVNGVAQNNQRGIEINNAQFRAGKVVIETIVPLYVSSVTVIGDGADGHTFSYKLEPEVDGKPRAVINKTITSASYSDSFQYSADN
jgi:hypothetical protein